MNVVVRSLAFDPDPGSLSADPGDFSLLLRALVGPSDGPGEEFVDIEIRTPESLARRCSAEGPVWGEHTLVVDWSTFDRAEVERRVVRRLERITGTTWADIGSQLARVGQWEFDSYRP